VDGKVHREYVTQLDTPQLVHRRTVARR
jgi:hypothetical protein